MVADHEVVVSARYTTYIEVTDYITRVGEGNGVWLACHFLIWPDFCQSGAREVRANS